MDENNEKQEKNFNFNLELQANNTPMNWTFKNTSQIEELAIWTMLKSIAEKQITKLLNK